MKNRILMDEDVGDGDYALSDVNGVGIAGEYAEVSSELKKMVPDLTVECFAYNSKNPGFLKLEVACTKRSVMESNESAWCEFETLRDVSFPKDS